MVRRVQLTLNPSKNNKDRIVSEQLEKIHNITHYIRILIVNDVNNNNEVGKRFYKEEYLEILADAVSPPSNGKVLAQPPSAKVENVTSSQPTTRAEENAHVSSALTIQNAKSLFGVGDD